MSFLRKSTFTELANVHAPHCISIYIPTHRAGNETGQELDRIHLKNQIKEAKNVLEKRYGLSPNEIEECLSPINELMDDGLFFTRQSDGLVIFIHEKKMQYFSCPIKFEPLAIISDHFYLRPIIPLLNDEGRFFLLCLSLHSSKLYEATEHAISEIATPRTLPQGITDVVGEDVVDNTVQFRSGQSTAPNDKTMFASHGTGFDNVKKTEALKYFQKLNDRVLLAIHEENVPLVVACVDYLFPLYQEANKYRFLADKPVEGNPEMEDIFRLKEKAWDIVEPVFRQHRKEEVDRYNLLLGRGKASFDPDQIIPAAISGQIETLFVRDGAFIWGFYNSETHAIKTTDHNDVDAVDLLNLAATRTILNNGKVYILPEEKMPDTESTAAAVFRYELAT